MKKLLTLLLCSVMVVSLAGCGSTKDANTKTDVSATSGKENADSKEAKSTDSGSENTDSSENSIYGYYDAICWAEWTEDGFTEDNVYPLEEGEYLILGEDGSLDLMIEGEEYHYDTVLEDNEFFFNGTSIGAITEDGSIYLDLNDEVRYIYAREGHPAWDEWREYLGN